FLRSPVFFINKYPTLRQQLHSGHCDWRETTPLFSEFLLAIDTQPQSQTTLWPWSHPDSDEADRWASLYPKRCFRKNQLHPRSFEPSRGWKFPLQSPDLRARCRRNVPLPARCLRPHLPRKGTPESASHHPKERSVRGYFPWLRHTCE